MYSVVRLIIGVLVLCVAIFAVRKFAQNHRLLLYSISFILSVVFVTVLGLLPFENLFTTFASPEEAYEYFTFGQTDIQLVVCGDESDLIIDNYKDTNRYLIVPKLKGGWGISTGKDTKRIVHKLDNGIVIYVYQYQSTDDYYATVLDTNGGYSDISDSCNSEFIPIEKENQTLGKVFVTYYAHISDLNSQYWISVNGMKFCLP